MSSKLETVSRECIKFRLHAEFVQALDILCTCKGSVA